jgi:hypothetical protein
MGPRQMDYAVPWQILFQRAKRIKHCLWAEPIERSLLLSEQSTFRSRPENRLWLFSSPFSRLGQVHTETA